MSDPRIRTADLADAERLTALMAQTFRDTYSTDRFGVCRPADVETYARQHFTAERQRAELADARLRTLIAEVDGDLAGYAQVRLDAVSEVAIGPRPVEVARFYVDRPWHGRGLARNLMRACIALASDADPLWLGVFEHNVRARAFYAKCGFTLVGRATFRMGDDVQDDLILARTPDAPPP